MDGDAGTSVMGMVEGEIDKTFKPRLLAATAIHKSTLSMRRMYGRVQ